MRTFLLILRLSFLICIALTYGLNVNGQIAINNDGSSAHPSAILDLQSTEAGFIMPRLTQAQRTGLGTTTDGLIVYQSDANQGYYLYFNGEWHDISTLETFRGNINMGVVPTVIGGSITAPMLSTIDVGELRVDFSPSMSTDYVVMVTPEFLPNPSAPIPDQDYCTANFLGVCSGSWENQEFGVFTPAGSTVSELNNFYSTFSAPTTLSNMIWHQPALYGPGCDAYFGNYDYHPDDNSVIEGPSVGVGFSYPIYNDPYDLTPFLGFNVTSTINSIVAGTSCDIVITGNEQNSTGTNQTVFIDWNSDGDFFDSVDGISELVITTPLTSWPAAGATSSPGYAYGTNVYTISVPPNAVNGDLALRTMVTRFTNNQSPCMTDNQGSARDYDFRVSGGVAAVRPGQTRTCNVHNQDLSGFEIRCYNENGNPVDNKIYLTINPR